MSFKRNVIANYASQIYVSLIGIVMAPMYLHYMGIEAYGLVGFHAAIQIWFGLLDMGLSLTLVRETARFKAKALKVLTYRRLVFALELIFLCMGAFGGLFLYFNSSRLALSWLNIGSLDADTVITCLQMMSGIVVMRWMSGFYRSVLTGMETFIWLSVFSTIIASLRFIGIIPIFIIWDGSLKTFFFFQCVIGIVELMGLYFKSREMLPPLMNNEDVSWSPKVLLVSVKHFLGFSISISLAAIAWAMMTQLDKLLLSWQLPLAQYGIFILAVMAASGVPLLVGPLGNTLLPRLARLHAQGDQEELMLLYERMTQVAAMLVAPLCYLLSSFSDKIMFVWTGDRLIASQGAALMNLYVLGNGLLVLATFPYYLQYANGRLKLHLAGCVIFLIVYVPTLLIMTERLGAIGAGYAWFLANSAYFLFWLPVVHRSFAKGLHMRWLTRDIVTPVKYSLISLFLFETSMSKFNLWPTERSSIMVVLVVAGMISVMLNFLSQTYFRTVAKSWVSKQISNQAAGYR